MNQAERIERQVEQQSPEELAAFHAWFTKFDAQRWNQQIVADFEAGKLDGLIAEARAECQTGQTREL